MLLKAREVTRLHEEQREDIVTMILQQVDVYTRTGRKADKVIIPLIKEVVEKAVGLHKMTDSVSAGCQVGVANGAGLHGVYIAELELVQSGAQVVYFGGDFRIGANGYLCECLIAQGIAQTDYAAANNRRSVSAQRAAPVCIHRFVEGEHTDGDSCGAVCDAKLISNRGGQVFDIAEALNGELVGRNRRRLFQS